MRCHRDRVWFRRKQVCARGRLQVFFFGLIWCLLWSVWQAIFAEKVGFLFLQMIAKFPPYDERLPQLLHVHTPILHPHPLQTYMYQSGHETRGKNRLVLTSYGTLQKLATTKLRGPRKLQCRWKSVLGRVLHFCFSIGLEPILRSHP